MPTNTWVDGYGMTDAGRLPGFRNPPLGEQWPNKYTTWEMYPVVGEVIQPSDVEKLSHAKETIAYWFRIGESALFKVADVVGQIEREGLYRFDLNPDSGNPYTSMTEYYPYLVKELKSSSHLHKLSERLVREVLRLDKVFVQGMGISRNQILDDGISRYTELAEALDYNHASGEVSESPRAGKIGKEQALQILQEAKEGGWSLEDMRAELDKSRGVERRSIHVVWKGQGNGPYILLGVTIFDGDKMIGDSTAGLSLELAQWVAKKLPGWTNLPKESR